MHIEIKAGFLKLTGLARFSTPPDRGTWPRVIYVKGSIITAVEPFHEMRGSPNASVVAGPTASLIVAESTEDIIEAISESYKQAGRR